MTRTATDKAQYLRAIESLWKHPQHCHQRDSWNSCHEARPKSTHLRPFAKSRDTLGHLFTEYCAGCSAPDRRICVRPMAALWLCDSPTDDLNRCGLRDVRTKSAEYDAGDQHAVFPRL
jgi:hypothetical protein